MDRIDIHIEVPSVKYEYLAGRSNGESSADIMKRVDRAMEMQKVRFMGCVRTVLNIFRNPLFPDSPWV